MTERPILFSAPMVKAILAGTKTMTRRVVAPSNAEFVSANRRFWSHGDFSRAFVDGRGSGSEYLHVPAHDGPCADCGYWGWAGTAHRLWPKIAPAYSWDQKADSDYTPPASRLWVREHYYVAEVTGYGSGNGFAIFDDEWTDGEPAPRELRPITGQRFGSHAAFHLPRLASRILLDVTDVRVERLGEISNVDALAEGCGRTPCGACDEVGCDECLGEGWVTERENFRRLWQSINGKRPGCDWASNPWLWVVSFRRVESTEARATA